MKKTSYLALLVALAAARAPAGEVAVLARNLSARSENVAPEYPQFGNLTLCVGKGGFMEWTVDVEGGDYYVHFLYCSGEKRPCRLSIDGSGQPGEALGETTGGFMPAHLAWKTHGPFPLSKGG
ncbi:MAG: carbohydrate-binding protein, partial [Planctomycetota bacterium]